MIAMPAARSMRHSRYQRLENRARVIFNGLASRAPPDYRHSPEWRPSGRSSGTQQQFQQCLLRMQAIFRLVPHHALRALDDLVAHLFAAVRGEAVHEQSVGFGLAHDVCRDLIRREGESPRLLFFFLSHAGPHVGDDQVGTASSRAAWMYEWHMLLPSPSQATVRPRMSPRCSK